MTYLEQIETERRQIERLEDRLANLRQELREAREGAFWYDGCWAEEALRERIRQVKAKLAAFGVGE